MEKTNKEHVLKFFGAKTVDEKKVKEARKFLNNWS